MGLNGYYGSIELNTYPTDKRVSKTISASEQIKRNEVFFRKFCKINTSQQTHPARLSFRRAQLVCCWRTVGTTHLFGF